jgi:hypothetical protein
VVDQYLWTSDSHRYIVYENNFFFFCLVDKVIVGEHTYVEQLGDHR